VVVDLKGGCGWDWGCVGLAEKYQPEEGPRAFLEVDSAPP
jgi:hypothetical protein